MRRLLCRFGGGRTARVCCLINVTCEPAKILHRARRHAACRLRLSAWSGIGDVAGTSNVVPFSGIVMTPQRMISKRSTAVFRFNDRLCLKLYSEAERDVGRQRTAAPRGAAIERMRWLHALTDLAAQRLHRKTRLVSRAFRAMYEPAGGFVDGGQVRIAILNGQDVGVGSPGAGRPALGVAVRQHTASRLPENQLPSRHVRRALRARCRMTWQLLMVIERSAQICLLSSSRISRIMKTRAVLGGR